MIVATRDVVTIGSIWVRSCHGVNIQLGMFAYNTRTVGEDVKYSFFFIEL